MTNSIPALTTEQMIEVDRLMIEVYHIELIQMMENAGRNLALQARRMLGGELSGRRVVVLAGAGNNGGGGLVCARHLHNWGAEVRVTLVHGTEQLKPVPAHQWDVLRRMGVAHDPTPDANPALIVEAMIGYGLQGSPRAPVAGWIRWTNAQGSPVLALDAPAGLDTSTGAPADPAVRATATLTLALPKVGLLSPAARAIVGALYVADISVPPGLYQHLGLDIGPLFAGDTIIPVPVTPF